MNLLSISQCGKITENDDHVVFMQNVPSQLAHQIMATLCDATGDTVRAQYMGLDSNGEPLPPEYANWVLTPEQRKAELDALRSAQK